MDFHDHTYLSIILVFRGCIGTLNFTLQSENEEKCETIVIARAAAAIITIISIAIDLTPRIRIAPRLGLEPTLTCLLNELEIESNPSTQPTY